MADDKNLVDAYASIYNKKEETEQLDEVVIPMMRAGYEAVKTANKVYQKGKEFVNKIRSKNQKVVPATPSSKMAANKASMSSPQSTPSPQDQRSSQMNSYEPEGEVVSEIVAPNYPNEKLEKRIEKLENKDLSPGMKVIKALTKGGGKVYANEDVAITHLDGSTTEIVDVVKPETLGDADSKLASRLWDQVAANLDTLGEMYGSSFDVFELEEKKEKKLDKVGEEDEDVDNDGDVDESDSYIKNKREKIGQAMGKKKGEKKDDDMKEEAEQIDEVDCWDTHKKVGMKKKGNKMVNDCRPKNESFNVKSPVVFSKPSEKVVEESISEETFEKHASSISRAHRAIKK